MRKWSITLVYKRFFSHTVMEFARRILGSYYKMPWDLPVQHDLLPFKRK